VGKIGSVDEYLAALPDQRRAVMQHLRQTIRDAAPNAIETIAYNMPALRLHGRFLLSYQAFKRHYSLFPGTQHMLEVFGEELAPYFSGKGTLRFPAEQPIPLDLIRRIVLERVGEVSASH
jgi:uncharacterized protein YdhG (YjbR/CyaY superfamily)